MYTLTPKFKLLNPKPFALQNILLPFILSFCLPTSGNTKVKIVRLRQKLTLHNGSTMCGKEKEYVTLGWEGALVWDRLGFIS